MQQREHNRPTKLRKTTPNTYHSLSELVSIRTHHPTNSFISKEELSIKLALKLQAAKKSFVAYVSSGEVVTIHNLSTGSKQQVPGTCKVDALTFVSDHELAIIYENRGATIWDFWENRFTLSQTFDSIYAERAISVGHHVIFTNRIVSPFDYAVWNIRSNEIHKNTNTSGIGIHISQYNQQSVLSCCGFDGTISIKNIEDGEMLHYIPFSLSQLSFAVCAWKDDQIVVACDNCLFIFNVVKNEVVHREDLGKSDMIILSVFKLNEKTIGFVYDEQDEETYPTLCIWDTEARKVMRLIPAVTSWSPLKGNLLAFFDENQDCIKVFDSNTMSATTQFAADVSTGSPLAVCD